ncbi:MAG: hypothetical protein HY293_11705 [Planctomycetes bacterium]|nr:hypothetical protein [Planctomycetota bacterium]
MGREIVYCWKCATRLQGADFDGGKAYRVGDKVSCPDCVDELVADLSAEEQDAILNPPKGSRTKTGGIKKISSTDMKPVEKTGQTSTQRTGTTSRPRSGAGPVTKVRTGTTGPVPTASTGVRKRVTASIPKVQPPPEEGDEGEEGEEAAPADKKKKIILFSSIGGGVFVLIVLVLIVVLGRKPEAKSKPTADVVEGTKIKPTAGITDSPKVKEAKALLKEAFEIKPEQIGLQIKKFRQAKAAAEGTPLAPDVESAIDDALARLDKAINAVQDEVKALYSSHDYKAVIDTYEKSKALHDIPEWTDRLDTKIKLTRNRADDTLHQFKKEVEDKKQAGDDPEIQKKKDIIAKWEMPELAEKFEKFLALLGSAEPDPSKNPPDNSRPPGPVKVKDLSPAMKAIMPAWQSAMSIAFARDYAGAANEMSGAAARAEAAEAKKAATEDVEALKAIGERYTDLLKTAGETAKLSTVTLEYQDKPGEWKKVTGKVVKVEPTRLEIQPDPVDKKAQPSVFVEITDLNAGSLAVLYKAKKKTLVKKDLDLLTKFALIEGAVESAQSLGGTAPDRYWIHAPEAREKAPKPNSREFEARILFHQSEFEWRKSITKYNSIEKSKVLLSEYTSTSIVKKYQPQIARRAETGKEYVFLPADLVCNGDYNTFKLKKDDPSWVASKGIDFKDSLFNYVEAEFIALPGLTYKCWVYAGGCCQEVWNGSYQTSEGVTKNKGKDVGIDPGVAMAAPLPYPSGLKKNHDDHKPKGAKEHPKTAAKWDWISIPLPKTYLAPGPKQVRILTDQQGFAVKYVIISATRARAPDDATAKDLAKEVAAAPAPKADVKGSPQAKEWFVIGPFADGLTNEQPPEKEIDLGKEYQGKSGKVKWKLASAGINGAQAVFDWDKSNLFNPKTNVSVYALIHVKAPADMDARLLISHDDGGRAWLQGTLVHDNNKGGAVKADEFNVPIKLVEGWNRLLVKVNQNTAGFGLMMRITDSAKAAIPGLEFSPYGDMLEPP